LWLSFPASRPRPTRTGGRKTTDEIRAKIADLEARLAELERDRTDVCARLDALRQESEAASLPVVSPRRPLLVQATVPTTPVEKVRLFRSLFRGREDVFPTRFVSKKTGKPGYAPACTDKFVPGVCGLPKVKCGECPNQAFAPVTDQAALDPLGQGDDSAKDLPSRWEMGVPGPATRSICASKPRDVSDRALGAE
jgi:hypothetical protein